MVNKLQKDKDKEKKNVTFSEDISEPEIVIINTTPQNTIENNTISEMDIDKKKKLSKQRRKNGLF